MRVPALILGALVTLSCSRLDKVRQCGELAATVNTAMDALRAEARAPESPAKYAKLSQGYRALATSVAALPVAQGGAQAELKEYASLLSSTADACKHLGDALAQGSKQETFRRELERLARRERLSVGKLDAYCQSP